MSKMKHSKDIYENIPIPEALSEVVTEAIQKADKSRKEKQKRQKIRRISGWSIGMAAGIIGALTIGINSSTAFAAGMQSIPILGALANVLTIHSYEESEGNVNITVEIPGIERIEEENKGLTQEINEEIYNICNAFAEEAIQRAKEYEEAFLATGGTQEEWEEHDIRIHVGYEIKNQSEKYLSFLVSGSENWTSAYAETRYYNLDIVSMKYMTLEDLLGENYIEIVNENIKMQIKEREENPDNVFFDEEDGGFVSINQDTKFYMNDKGDPVIVFDKYEIAPGSMGMVEFEINI